MSTSSSVMIEPPADLTTRSVVEKAAKFVAKQGLEMESKMIQCLGDKARYEFLKHPTDPCYLYYKQKIAEYSAQKQDDDEEEEEFDATNITPDAIFDQPPHVSVGTLVERTALLVALKGSSFATTVIKRTANDPRFGFLRSWEAPLYNYYMLRLAKHCSDHKGGAEAFNREVEIARTQQPSFQSKTLPLPNFLHFRLPKGMTMEEVNLVKVTAQFGAWYGVEFLLELTEREMKTDNIRYFGFMDPSDSRFSFYSELIIGFTQVMKLPEGLREKLRENPAYLAAIVDGFFLRIQWDRVQEIHWMHQGQNAMDEWHDSVTKYFFANEEEKQKLSPPQGRYSKRQKLVDPSLVLEDQFLAQHPGPCTIRVRVPKGQLIEITVQSLSETVASLKEKVAAEVQILANNHKLSGKAGAFEDDRSLAHYNVGAGEILTLSVRTWCDMKRLEGNASSSP